MKESTLLKISIIITFIGIAFLYILTDNIEVAEKTIDKITIEDADEYVKLAGIISRITETEKVYFMEMTQPQTISIIVFKGKDNETELNLQKGNSVEIIGKIDEYEGKMNIIGNRVRKID